MSLSMSEGNNPDEVYCHCMKGEKYHYYKYLIQKCASRTISQIFLKEFSHILRILYNSPTIKISYMKKKLEIIFNLMNNTV